MTEDKSIEIAVQSQGKTEIARVSGESWMEDSAKLEHLWRIAGRLSASELVPKHFQGKPENTFVALMAISNLGIDPFMGLQKMFVVGGKLGMEAQLVIALANQRGPYPSGIQYEVSGKGEDLAVTAIGVRRDGQRDTCTVTYRMAKDMGWIKNHATWTSAPLHRLKLRAAAWLIREHCPEVTCGLDTREELEDMPPERKQSAGAAELNAIVEGER